MLVRNNSAARIALGNLNKTNRLIDKRLEKLSSGLRINKAADDAAGLAISEKMRSQIRGLDQAARNAQDGISMIQTAEGALGDIHSILQRMRELAVQGANDTLSVSDRGHIQDEIDSLVEEIDRIAKQTEFNNQKLIDGSKAGWVSRTVQFTANYICVWQFSSNPSPGKRIGIDDMTSMTHANFEFRAPNDIDYAAHPWIDTPIGNDLASTLANLKDTYDRLKMGTIRFPTEVNTVQNTDMFVYGNTVVLTTSNVISASTSSGINGTLVSGSPATYSLSIQEYVSGATLQIGANAGQQMEVFFPDATANALGIYNLNVSTATDASAAIATIDDAIAKISDGRSKLGAFQNRLEHSIENVNTAKVNLSASESRIRDADMAKEMVGYTKSLIIAQAGQAVLAQANSASRQILNLLQT